MEMACGSCTRLCAAHRAVGDHHDADAVWGAEVLAGLGVFFGRRLAKPERGFDRDGQVACRGAVEGFEPFGAVEVAEAETFDAAGDSFEVAWSLAVAAGGECAGGEAHLTSLQVAKIGDGAGSRAS